MPYKKSKYSAATRGSVKMAVIDVLNTYPQAMTITEICASDMTLMNQTTQFMSRILNELVEMGMVKKAKSKKKKRMVYMAVCHLDKAYDEEDQSDPDEAEEYW